VFSVCNLHYFTLFLYIIFYFFFFQAEDGIRDATVTGVQTCALPISCYNALDRHVEQGRADQPALIYDSPVTGTIKTFTYRELRRSEERRVGKECGTGRAR